jgi:hypothetical protein
MTLSMSVTYEFQTRTPQTWRGTLTGSSPETCARLAVKAARKALAPQVWTSYVCVALERLDVQKASRRPGQAIAAARILGT